MFLKLLEKLGRKKLILDRGPSHLKHNEAKPWMNRLCRVYFLLSAAHCRPDFALPEPGATV